MFRFFRYIALLVGIAAALPAAADKELSAAQQRKFDYYFYEGLKLKQDGKYDAAYDLFNYCLEIDSTAAPVLYELSSFYVQMNKADRAVEMLRRAAQDEPENFTYQMALANVSRNLGMFTEAAEQYEKLAREYPEKPELYYYLGESRTLVTHPASTTHSQLAPEQRRAAGISDGMLRLSVGIEDARDIIADLKRGLAAAAR